MWGKTTDVQGDWKKETETKEKLKCVTENYVGFYEIPKSHGLIACGLILHFSCHRFYAKTKGKQFPNLASNVGCGSMHSFHKR